MSASGDWQVTVNSPMGVQKGTLTLAANGAVLSGKVVIPQGSESFANGKISGNDISGKVKLGMFGNASFSGKRV
jgi:hypothetical protein